MLLTNYKNNITISSIFPKEPFCRVIPEQFFTRSLLYAIIWILENSYSGFSVFVPFPTYATQVRNCKMYRFPEIVFRNDVPEWQTTKHHIQYIFDFSFLIWPSKQAKTCLQSCYWKLDHHVNDWLNRKLFEYYL